MVELTSTATTVAALGQAQTICAEAYTLHGPVLYALEAAARRGAAVSVQLEGRPVEHSKGHLAAENRRLVRELRAAGANASLAPGIHAKAIAADGALYLDEKNWQSGDLVLRETDPNGARLIPMDKRDALERERALLDGARASDGVIVESETFGSYNAVHHALAALGRAGAAPRLLVDARELQGNARERRVLQELAGEGVSVRVCSESEKLAVRGGQAWLGSANATSPYGRGAMTDWGLCTDDAQIVQTVRARLEAEWRAAKPFTAILRDRRDVAVL